MKNLFRTAMLCALAAFSATFINAQTTEFTYQGRLTDGGQTSSGNYDFEFKLFDAEAGGAEIGTLQRLDVTVTNGIFSVKLDFGANFNGQPRFLEIAARASATQGAFTILSPRQPFTSVPYSIKSLNAETAINAAQLGGVEANQFITTNDPRMTDERPPAPNSPNYIQNTTATQAGSNFSISGNGTLGGTLSAGTVNAATQFNLGGRRVFTADIVSSNTVFGLGTGDSLTTGVSNTFFGSSVGTQTTTGDRNSFFGVSAGVGNTTGRSNSFFGFISGINNRGSENSYFGDSTGVAAGLGSGNTLIGATAGRQNLGSDNTFVGREAGGFFAFGDNNSIVGSRSSIISNQGAAVNSSTMIGAGARIRATNNALSFVTVIGAGAEAATSNTVVLGRNLDTVEIPGALNVAGGTSFGGTLSANRINTLTDFAVGGATVFKTLGNSSIFIGIDSGAANTTGGNNVFVGHRAGESNTIGAANAFLGDGVGSSNTTGSFNTFNGFRAGASNTVGLFNSFFGANAGVSNTDGNNNTFLGMEAGRNNTSGSFNVFSGYSAGGKNLTGGKNVFSGFAAGLNNTTGENNVFVGMDAGKANIDGSSNTVIGSNSDLGNANLSFATAVGAGAVVNASNTIQLGRSADTVNVSGFVTLQTLGLGGSQVLCRNGSLQIGICSSSLRYKTNIAPFDAGLKLVSRLRPITFDWKTDGTRDLGLAAEEVAAVEPLLAVRNEQGEVEGVKYDRLGVVLLNAVKEQQAQIEAQQKFIEKQQAAIDGLKKLVCGQTPNADVCMEEQK